MTNFHPMMPVTLRRIATDRNPRKDPQEDLMTKAKLMRFGTTIGVLALALEALGAAAKWG